VRVLLSALWPICGRERRRRRPLRDDPAGITRVKVTQDGGKPGVLQHFIGPECGADGWVSFRNDPPTGSWASMVARLDDTPTATCPQRLNRAFTRWRLENITWTFYEGSSPRTVTLPTIISEHYDKETIAASKAMERFFYAKGAGRVRWSSWRKAAPVGAQLPMRCPPMAYDVAPDDSGWNLSDFAPGQRLSRLPPAGGRRCTAGHPPSKWLGGQRLRCFTALCLQASSPPPISAPRVVAALWRDGAAGSKAKVERRDVPISRGLARVAGNAQPGQHVRAAGNLAAA
jgi:hypothetical protein